MKSRIVTESKLRGVIKKALNESLQEIIIDQKINLLRAKGPRRSLQETKQYRKLLEMKLAIQNGTLEEFILNESFGDTLKSLFGFDGEKKAVVAAIAELQKLNRDTVISYLNNVLDAKAVNKSVDATWYNILGNNTLEFLDKFQTLLNKLSVAQEVVEKKEKKFENPTSEQLNKYVRTVSELSGIIRGGMDSTLGQTLVVNEKLIEPIKKTIEIINEILGVGNNKGFIAKYEKK